MLLLLNSVHLGGREENGQLFHNSMPFVSILLLTFLDELQLMEGGEEEKGVRFSFLHNPPESWIWGSYSHAKWNSVWLWKSQIGAQQKDLFFKEDLIFYCCKNYEGVSLKIFSCQDIEIIRTTSKHSNFFGLRLTSLDTLFEGMFCNLKVISFF